MTGELLKTYSKDKSVLIITKRTKPKPSIAYNTYWKFAAERQNIFFKRFHGESYPWTKDEILNQYKFTNVYRATDRVSQYLINNVIYKGSQKPEEVFFRILLFKIFNRISTWEVLEYELGKISFKDYSFNRYDKVLSEVMYNSIPIYSAAYIMASGRSTFGYERKHQNHLRLIELMIKEKVPYKLLNCKSMSLAYNLLHSYPTIGDFLAYQYVTDINYSKLTNFTEMEFVKAGPGARDGIVKCFKDFCGYSFEDIIHLMVENQEQEFERLNLDFKNLWGRKLQLIDCQNIFCEVDKYSRVAHPEIEGLSNRTRIKQKYKKQQNDSIEYFFPPKWNIKI
ncbi:nucleotide kinase domain-containing protein [Flavobacterium sp. SUN046]|uniref:nucleotide kinase domain-containing protein n=1 Tax=Flavobacterium sp. SUN046 TaxID=3002440 RepID=UPI002DBAAC83|nr:nucleotide kinase domain-containing protein [Flavobacterium sp. SUN046]MEC4048948.1 nucleotide kinase domain-containing protein [Flavobacterium sp. SUN046]